MALSDKFTVTASKCRSDGKHPKKTMIQRRLTVFCKLAILWEVIGFSKNFIVKAPKCAYDGKHQKTRSKRRFRDV